jgi:hypothetical protein
MKATAPAPSGDGLDDVMQVITTSHIGNHLLTNVSVLDYLLSEGDLYMPLTGRANHDLTLASVRSTFADGFSPRPRVSRPVTAYPTHGDQVGSAEDGGGDRWLKWETNDLSRHAKELSLTLSQGALSAAELIEFGTFFQRVIGRPPPAVLYFSHGAQFAASRAALRSTSKETYEWILELVEAGHFEVTFYLEMSWLYVLHGAPATDWDAPTVDSREAGPYLNHLAEARAVFEAKGGANVERRALAASPEPEVSPPSSPSDTGNTGNLSGKDAGSKAGSKDLDPNPNPNPNPNPKPALTLVEGGRLRKRRRESDRRWTEQNDGRTLSVGPPAYEDKKAREERFRRLEEREGCIVWRPVLQGGKERDARRMARAVGMHGRSGVSRQAGDVLRPRVQANQEGRCMRHGWCGWKWGADEEAKALAEAIRPKREVTER